MFYIRFLLLGIWFLRANMLMKQILMLGCFRSGLDGEEKEWIARSGGRRALGLRGGVGVRMSVWLCISMSCDCQLNIFFEKE